MALTINSAHPLAAKLVEAMGVDNGAMVALVNTSRTITPSAGVTFGNGAYGSALKAQNNGYTLKGAVISPAIAVPTNTITQMTVVVVANAFGASDGNRVFFGATNNQPFNVALNSSGKVEAIPPTGGVPVSTTTVTGGGAYSVAIVRNADVNGKLYINGVLESTSADKLNWSNANHVFDSIGGVAGFGTATADVVWIFVFNDALTDAQLLALHQSLGAGNTMTANGQTALINNSATSTPTVSSVTVSPATPTVTGGTTQQFTATVAGTNSPGQGVTWTASAGTINSSGLFTAPAATGASQSITITATSTVDNTKSGAATVTVPATGAPPITYTGVSVSPSTATVIGLATQQFTASVSGTGTFSTAVTWSVDGGSTNGTINSSGLYTAPAAGVAARNVVVRAVAADGTTAGTAAVTIPAAAAAGSFVTEAMVNNTGQVLANTSVRWSWFPGGRIGAFSGITPVEGVGTTNAQGQLTATGLAAGAGLMVAAQWINGATDDVVFYQAGTVN